MDITNESDAVDGYAIGMWMDKVRERKVRSRKS